MNIDSVNFRIPEELIRYQYNTNYGSGRILYVELYSSYSLGKTTYTMVFTHTAKDTVVSYQSFSMEIPKARMGLKDSAYNVKIMNCLGRPYIYKKAPKVLKDLYKVCITEEDKTVLAQGALGSKYITVDKEFCRELLNALN